MTLDCDFVVGVVGVVTLRWIKFYARISIEKMLNFVRWTKPSRDKRHENACDMNVSWIVHLPLSISSLSLSISLNNKMGLITCLPWRRRRLCVCCVRPSPKHNHYSCRMLLVLHTRSVVITSALLVSCIEST